jgi:hypothetical protein
MTEEIRDRLGRYLAGELSASELARELPDGWDLDEYGDRDARALVLRIVGNLSEFQNGDLNEVELQDRLRVVLPSARTYWKDASTVASGAEFVVTRSALAATNERSPVVECV